MTQQFLKQQINAAEHLLADAMESYNQGDLAALKDMIIQAQLSLLEPPEELHSGKREFMPKPSVTQRMEYAWSRYTMVPTYLEKNYGTYGLKEAMEWFKGQDRRLKTDAELVEMRQRLCKDGEKFLAEIQSGTNVGAYPEGLIGDYQNAIAALQEVQEKERNELIRKIVKTEDACRELCCSRIWYSDLHVDHTLFLTEQDWQECKKQINGEELARGEFRKIKQEADKLTLEEVRERWELKWQDDDYSYLNQKFSLWSKTEGNVNFLVPPQAIRAKFCFSLGTADNEADGLGHVYINEIEINSSQNVAYPLVNSDFTQGTDMPQAWSPVVSGGTPRLCWDSKQGTLYLGNPDSSCAGGWEYDEWLYLEPGQYYNLRFTARLEGKMRRGLEARITFYDKHDHELEPFIHFFNRKSYIACGDYNLRMQCDAICYKLTGERSYAEKVKYEILHMMDDFIQGIEHWLYYNERPEGSDAYGAVQGGRNLCSIAFAYSVIRGLELFRPDEKACFMRMLDYYLRYMIDFRNRINLTPEEAQRKTGNWQTDMCIGTVFILSAVQDYPERKVWMENALQVLRGQLDCNINQDGSWPESLRYHHAALGRFACLARLLRFELGEDWFSSTRLKDMFRYSFSVQTPGYCFFDGHIATPPFGDHRLGGGEEYSLHGLHYRDFEAFAPELAEAMYEAWERAGYPVRRIGGEDLVVENLLYVKKPHKPSVCQNFLHSSKEFPDSGIYMFRKGQENGKQSYCAFMSSPKKIAHGHLDQGSFIIYKDNIPVVMDGGIEGYFDASTQWYLSSYAHACLMFQTKRSIEEAAGTSINLTAGDFSRKQGWEDVPVCSKVLGCEMGGAVEWIQIEVENPAGPGRHYRTLMYLREEDCYLIFDRIEDFDGLVQFSLPMIMKQVLEKENGIVGIGYYDIDLQVEFLSHIQSYRIEYGRMTPMVPNEENHFRQPFLRATATAEDGFVTLIAPTSNSQVLIKAEMKEQEVHLKWPDGRLRVIQFPQ